jgi:N-hydroxyarylamine O-acetyltransferase
MSVANHTFTGDEPPRSEGEVPRLSPSELRAYLLRIGVDPERPFESAEELLTHLHERHLRSVPFENIDPVADRPVRFDLPTLLQKIVGRCRGGICYELNLLFATLLRTLGFSVDLLTGDMNVVDSRHALLLVRFDGRQYIADVGYGCYFVRPLRLAVDEAQEDDNGRYRLVGDRVGELGIERWVREQWHRLISFTLRPISHSDVETMWAEYLSRPDPEFIRHLFMQRRMADGWAMLRDDVLVLHHVGTSERMVVSSGEREAVYFERFGIRLDADDEVAAGAA